LLSMFCCVTKCFYRCFLMLCSYCRALCSYPCNINLPLDTVLNT
jgi:hypothetical protein